MLAGISSTSLAGSEEQINFSQKSPKMLKMASESFIHALLLFSGLFRKISRWVPLNAKRLSLSGTLKRPEPTSQSRFSLASWLMVITDDLEHSSKSLFPYDQYEM